MEWTLVGSALAVILCVALAVQEAAFRAARRDRDEWRYIAELRGMELDHWTEWSRERIDDLERGGCDRPPAGWRCTRGEDHAGPCAATPVAD